MTTSSPRQPEGPTKVVPIRMPDDLIAAIQAMADDKYEGNFSMAVRMAAKEMLKQEGYLAESGSVAA